MENEAFDLQEQMLIFDNVFKTERKSIYYYPEHMHVLFLSTIHDIRRTVHALFVEFGRRE